MKRLVLLATAILLLGALLFTSCGSSETTAPTTTQSTTNSQTSTASQPATTSAATSQPAITTQAAATEDKAKYGGKLRIIYPFSPTSTPGWPADSVNMQRGWMGFICFEHLVNLDKAGQPIPLLAKSWEWGPNNQSITFTLREGVKFHDGTPFTSEAVKIEADLVMAAKLSNAINWASWEVIDDYHIKLNLAKYETNFWENIQDNSMMFFSPTAYKKSGEEWMRQHPIGTGPFKFASFEKDVALKFVRNDDYWQKGKPYLDAIDMLTVKEELTAEGVMQSGGGDVWLCQMGKVLGDMKAKGFNVIPDSGGTNFLVFDTANADSKFKDVRVRQAVEYAIDKQAIVDTLGYGFGAVTYQIAPPSNAVYNKNIGTRAYNPDKAKALLKEAGYPDGFKSNIITMGSSTTAMSIQEYLAAVGIEVTLEPVDNAKFFNYLMKGWQNGMIAPGYAVGGNIPAWLRMFFPPSPMAAVSTKMPDAVVAKIQPALTETDPTKAKQLSDEILQLLFDDATFVPVSSNFAGSIYTNKVHDSGINTFYDFWKWTPADCWLSK